MEDCVRIKTEFMKKTKRRLKKPVKIALISIACLAVCILGILVLPRNTVLSQGQKYLKQQEEKAVDDLSEKLKETKYQELQQGIDEGKVDLFALFDDAVIFGDSRAMGFSVYHFFPDSHVLADSGATVEYISNWLDQVETINPTYIFFSYGVNDMGMRLDDVGGYDKVYQEQIQKVLERCPDATIAVNSIIPATDEAVAESPSWNKVDEYNAKVKSMCQENGWIYIDNTEISQNGDAPIYQADGVHFLQSFYATWAENMILSLEQNKD